MRNVAMRYDNHTHGSHGAARQPGIEMRYTFTQRYAARTMRGNNCVYLPDQVAEAQKDYDGRTFPVLRRDGSKTRATLRGAEYGLWTTGVGDPVVRLGSAS